MCGSDEIAELWRQHYCELFNCIRSDTFETEDVDSSENIFVSPDEVYHAILKLENNKACGADHITAEHLKYASCRVIPLLALCFSVFFKHGILPDSMIAVQFVPVIKGILHFQKNVWSFYRLIRLLRTPWTVFELLDSVFGYLISILSDLPIQTHCNFKLHFNHDRFIENTSSFFW